jgi:dGTPase
LSQLYRAEDWERPVAESTSSQTYRSPARQDYARVIHSPSFRRLQGKTQLFPGIESDFFRNRLTHSLEVAQIAESIAFKLNDEHPYFKENPIDPRLCATAALVHDMGHPPFGHNGEHALDDKMLEFGGFEGNAQTFHILTRLEKKRFYEISNGDGNECVDLRAGLNLSFRTLAASLKYDNVIDHVRADTGLIKGYYATDAQIVDSVKDAVCPEWRSIDQPFKTIECAIMDIADDIAYSTYDLEDSMKAGFLTPADILSSDPELFERVAIKVEKACRASCCATDVAEIFIEMFASIVENGDDIGGYAAIRAHDRSKKLAADGHLRTAFTSQLVGEFIDGVRVQLDEKFPALSKVYLEAATLRKVESLKNYTYEATIYSTRLKVAEYRGYEVVTGIFEALSSPKGYLLMPEDTRALYAQFESNATARRRTICDFVAGMTDRYALEFYGRLHSDTPQSIFKPT